MRSPLSDQQSINFSSNRQVKKKYLINNATAGLAKNRSISPRFVSKNELMDVKNNENCDDDET